MSQAIQCVAEMPRYNLTPNAFTYSAAISACKHRPETALELFQQLLVQQQQQQSHHQYHHHHHQQQPFHHSMSPPFTDITTTAITSSLISSTTTPNALEANTVVYTSLLNVLAPYKNYTEKCFEILEEMELYGPKPNIYTYNSVLKAFAEEGNLEVNI
jgi:pentatricopeptide repeat protein